MINDRELGLKSEFLGKAFFDAHRALGMAITDETVRRQLQKRVAEVIWEANNQFCTENNFPDGIRTDKEKDMATMDLIQERFLQNRGFLKDTVFSDGRYEVLKDKLLTRGGDAVILTVNIDDIYKRLLNDGEFFNKIFPSYQPADNAFEGVKSHELNNIYVGFQLDADDLWRYSTWGMSTPINENEELAVFETTAVVGKLYYGVPV